MTSVDPRRNVPPGVDITVPSPARVYDVVLGGTNNYDVDRALAEPILKHAPSLRDLARDNRQFLGRAVSCLLCISSTMTTTFMGRCVTF